MQIAQHHFNSKILHKKQRTAGGMPNQNPYRFWRDQALRLLCLKGHVRARGSTLWHRWQEASEFLCTKTPLCGGSWEPKNITKENRKCSLRRDTNVMFSRFRSWRRKASRGNRIKTFCWQPDVFLTKRVEGGGSFPLVFLEMVSLTAWLISRGPYPVGTHFGPYGGMGVITGA